MHVQAPRGLGNVAITQLINALDMLPAHAIRGHRIFRQYRLFLGGRKQGRCNLICVGGFLQIVESAKLHCSHSGGNVAVTGEDYSARIGATLLQR